MDTVSKVLMWPQSVTTKTVKPTTSNFERSGPSLPDRRWGIWIAKKIKIKNNLTHCIINSNVCHCGRGWKRWSEVNFRIMSWVWCWRCVKKEILLFPKTRWEGMKSSYKMIIFSFGIWSQSLWHCLATAQKNSTRVVFSYLESSQARTPLRIFCSWYLGIPLAWMKLSRLELWMSKDTSRSRKRVTQTTDRVSRPMGAQNLTQKV